MSYRKTWVDIKIKCISDHYVIFNRHETFEIFGNSIGFKICFASNKYKMISGQISIDTFGAKFLIHLNAFALRVYPFLMAMLYR